MICPRCNNEMTKTETPGGYVCLHCGKGSRDVTSKPVRIEPIHKKADYEMLFETEQYCPFCNAVHKVYLCKDLCTDLSNKSLELFFCHKDDSTRRFTNATSENLEHIFGDLENKFERVSNDLKNKYRGI